MSQSIIFCAIIIYIPIWLNSNFLVLPAALSYQQNLHSNMVKFKFKTTTLLHTLLGNLHSNMVKFKFFISVEIKPSINYLHSNMVKFKCDMANSVIGAYRIYIPIWLNSNKRQESKLFLNNLIYIPIWLNSNLPCYVTAILSDRIYIPIWLNSNNKSKIKY